jgi:hypothetical protein
MDGINLNPNDEYVSLGGDTTLPGEIKVNFILIDDLSEADRNQLVKIPRQPGPRRQAGTGWFLKF